jgi:toxin-antitoxin system PIN domain toxin
LAFLYDSSVWLALIFNAHPAHKSALRAFDRATNNRPACFCRATQQSFLRLISTPAVLRAYGAGAMTNADALQMFDDLMANPVIDYRDEPRDITGLWPRNAMRSAPSPKTWMDAYLAAFSLGAKLTLVTFDRDFEAYAPSGLDLLQLT